MADIYIYLESKKIEAVEFIESNETAFSSVGNVYAKEFIEGNELTLSSNSIQGNELCER